MNTFKKYYQYYQNKPLHKKIYRKIFLNITDYLMKELSDCNSVLDLGCGPDSLVRFSEIYKVGVEAFEPYLEESKRKGIHNKYIKEDITKVEFKPKSFDAVIMIDVIEHISKQEAEKLLNKVEIWAKKKVIIFTPNGFMERGVIENNPFQEHKSGWQKEEFEKRGFSVFGLQGLKWLRGGEGADVKFKPSLLWLFISDLTQKIVYYFPQYAFALLAIKKVN